MTEPVSFTISDKPSPGGVPKSARGGSKRGPGRPSAPTAKHRADTDAALSTMNSAYNLLSMGALLLRRPHTASLIAANGEQWQAGNREAFESSPKLAAAIANVGQTSGVVTFFVTNAVALVQIVGALRSESASIAEANSSADTSE